PVELELDLHCGGGGRSGRRGVALAPVATNQARAQKNKADEVFHFSLCSPCLRGVNTGQDCSEACQCRSAKRLIRLTSRNSVKPRREARSTPAKTLSTRCW